MRSAMLLAFTLLTLAPAAAAPAIDVAIENRFRLLASEADEKIYARDLDQRRACTRDDCLDDASAIRMWRGGDRNYATRWDPQHWRFETDYAHDLKRTIRLTAAKAPKNAVCDWVVSTAGAGAELFKGKSDCRKGATAVVTLGADRRLKIDVKAAAEAGDWRATLEKKDVVLRDVLIATLGDSFLSGEGNPHRFIRRPNEQAPGDDPSGVRSEWLDVRCHRSLFTGAAIGSFLLAQKHRTQSVTFAPLACSGAEIAEGLLTANYLGRESAYQAANFPEALSDPGYLGFPNQFFYAPNGCSYVAVGPSQACVLPPQTKTLIDTLCKSGACERPDVIVVSSGGNEMGFGTILRQVSMKPPKGAEAKIRKELERRWGVLDQLYVKMHAAIGGFSPKNVFAVGYLDPTRKGPGAFCDDLNGEVGDRTFVPDWTTGLGFGITAKWARIAHRDIIVPLNAKFRKLAEDHKAEGWRFVTLADSLMAQKGYCARKSWFLTYDNADLAQGIIAADIGLKNEGIGALPSGAMHPNIFGHYRMGGEFILQFENAGLVPK